MIRRVYVTAQFGAEGVRLHEVDSEPLPNGGIMIDAEGGYVRRGDWHESPDAARAAIVRHLDKYRALLAKAERHAEEFESAEAVGWPVAPRAAPKADRCAGSDLQRDGSRRPCRFKGDYDGYCPGHRPRPEVDTGSER